MSNIGKTIQGFCDGYFGYEDYEEKRIEAEGIDWIVCRATNVSNNYYPKFSNSPRFASFKNEEEKNIRIKDWSKKKQES